MDTLHQHPHKSNLPAKKIPSLGEGVESDKTLEKVSLNTKLAVAYLTIPRSQSLSYPINL